MKHSLLAFGLGLLLVLSLQAQETEARATIDKALKAHGDSKDGDKLLKAIAKGKGRIHIMDMDFDLTLQSWLDLPGKTKEIVKITGNDASFEIMQAVVGNKGWAGINGNFEEMDEDELKEAREMMHVDLVTNLVGLRNDKELKLAPLPETKVGGQEAVAVKVSKKGRRDVNLYFDKKSNLLVKAQYRAIEPFSDAEVTQEAYYSAYKEFVPGYKSPSKITVKNDDRPFLELELTEIRPVDRHEDKVFARPDELP